MRWISCLVVVVVALALLPQLSAEDGIEVGMTREEVVRAFGEPPSRMANGEMTVFIYPHLRVVLKNHSVASYGCWCHLRNGDRRALALPMSAARSSRRRDNRPQRCQPWPERHESRRACPNSRSLVRSQSPVVLPRRLESGLFKSVLQVLSSESLRLRAPFLLLVWCCGFAPFESQTGGQTERARLIRRSRGPNRLIIWRGRLLKPRPESLQRQAFRGAQTCER